MPPPTLNSEEPVSPLLKKCIDRIVVCICIKIRRRIRSFRAHRLRKNHNCQNCQNYR